jgi:hypothetical protein
MVTFEMVADWPSPDEPPFRPTTQLVAAYDATPAKRMPQATETIFIFDARCRLTLAWTGALLFDLGSLPPDLSLRPEPGQRKCTFTTSSITTQVKTRSSRTTP